ncbi:MAG: glutamate racemase [Acidobacteriota bacterium]
MSADAPIGVFDSGVGGLTVVDELRRQLPNESILYLGDTARLPYGTKSQATVTEYTRRNLAFLRERNVKAMVVACNTASALALPYLVAEEPTWGVIEPGAVRAAATSRGRVGVIATEATVLSNAYGAALERLRPDLEVWSEACALFVPLVEEGWQDDPVAELVAERYLAPLRVHRVDTVVLGCTHYPLLLPVLKRVLGDEVELVDSGAAVAGFVATGLATAGLLRASAAPPEYHFCVTDSARRFGRLARRILGDAEVSLEHVDVR